MTANTTSRSHSPVSTEIQAGDPQVVSRADVPRGETKRASVRLHTLAAPVRVSKRRAQSVPQHEVVW